MGITPVLLAVHAALWAPAVRTSDTQVCENPLRRGQGNRFHTDQLDFLWRLILIASVFSGWIQFLSLLPWPAKPGVHPLPASYALFVSLCAAVNEC